MNGGVEKVPIKNLCCPKPVASSSKLCR